VKACVTWDEVVHPSVVPSPKLYRYCATVPSVSELEVPSKSTSEPTLTETGFALRRAVGAWFAEALVMVTTTSAVPLSAPCVSLTRSRPVYVPTAL
jgi:hypothetical protein